MIGRGRRASSQHAGCIQRCRPLEGMWFAVPGANDKGGEPDYRFRIGGV